MTTTAPNWEALREICERAKLLQDAGQMTHEAFDALFAEALVAVNGHTQFVEALVAYMPEDMHPADGLRRPEKP